jgi:hypothetical protein
MSQDAERVRRLVEFREKLAKKVEEVEAEFKDLQATLETVNSILLEKGFKRADTIKDLSGKEEATLEKEIEAEPEESTHETAVSSENVIPLKTGTGELLAVLHLTENSLRALPAADKNFEINTPPFIQFLVERVLMKMQERDDELARTGQLLPENVLSYDIVKEGDVIREICIRNVDPERQRELKSSIRWTLEKMYEKTRQQG